MLPHHFNLAQSISYTIIGTLPFVGWIVGLHLIEHHLSIERPDIFIFFHTTSTFKHTILPLVARILTLTNSDRLSTCTNTRNCKHTRARIHTHTHTHIYKHIHIHIHIYIHMHMHIHIYIHIHTHLHMHIHRHPYTDTYTHTYAYTNT